jgi:hypothetical protein
MQYQNVKPYTGDTLMSLSSRTDTVGRGAPTIDAPIRRAVEGWHEVVRQRQPAGIDALLADDVVFHSPVVHTPQRGRDITFKYLSSAEKVLGGPGFSYVGEWRSDSGAVLEFKTMIDGIEINGVDIISFDSEGRITHFKVMVRPLKAINMLHRLMAEQLAAAQS